MSAQEEHRCIAWRRAASPLPEALAGALARRGISPDIETDCFGALAAVLLAHRSGQVGSGRAGTRSGGDHVPPTILLLIEPEELAGVASVVRAAESYAPAAVCWAFESRANPALRAVTPSDLERWDSPASMPTGPARQDEGMEPARDLPASSEPAAGEPDADGLGEDFQPGVVEVLSGRTFVRRASEERGVREVREPAPRPLPPLRLAGEGPIGPLGVNSDPSAAELGGDTPGQDPASGLLTAEELEMLLADDEDARGHG
ncbi:MAG: hypothetical protein ACF8SC_02965 [Phycisphaerales bacterium JB037]